MATLIIPGLNKIYSVVPRKSYLCISIEKQKPDSTMEIEGKIIRDPFPFRKACRVPAILGKEGMGARDFRTVSRQVCFHFFGDRVDSNPLRIGESYAISYDIESRGIQRPLVHGHPCIRLTPARPRRRPTGRPGFREANRLPDTDSPHQE